VPAAEKGCKFDFMPACWVSTSSSGSLAVVPKFKVVAGVSDWRSVAGKREPHIVPTLPLPTEIQFSECRNSQHQSWFVRSFMVGIDHLAAVSL
jgi:hypothetical protein